MNDNTPVESSTKLKDWLRKNAQILYGFFGWYVINGLIWLIIFGGSLKAPQILYARSAIIYIFTLNLLLLLVLRIVKIHARNCIGNSPCSGSKFSDITCDGFVF